MKFREFLLNESNDSISYGIFASKMRDIFLKALPKGWMEVRFNRKNSTVEAYLYDSVDSYQRGIFNDHAVVYYTFSGYHTEEDEDTLKDEVVLEMNGGKITRDGFKYWSPKRKAYDEELGSFKQKSTQNLNGTYQDFKKILEIYIENGKNR